ncbi:MAG: hypothetical protein ACYDDA_10795 [Acidiferrobacteraceae bacterium]
MTRYYYIEPGEVVPASKQSALAAAGIDIAQATLPSGALASGNMWAPTTAAMVNGVLTQQWAQVPMPIPGVPQQASTILNHGVPVVSLSTPALNGTYPLDTKHLDYITSLVAGISAGQGLPNGASTVDFFDSAGAPHAFTGAQLISLGAALRNVVYTCEMVLAGAPAALPALPVSIP